MYLLAALTTLVYASWYFRYDKPEVALISFFNLLAFYLLFKLFGVFKSNKGW